VEKPCFPPKFWRQLAKENPLGRNDITPQDAHDWFELTWPKMREYCKPGSIQHFRKRVVNWWHKLKFTEIERARAYGQQLRRTAQTERLTIIASKVLPSEPKHLKANLPPLRTSRGGENG
jgi:hypothetical protein